jgi:hypothetical protein
VAVTDAQIGRACVDPEKLDAGAARRQDEIPVLEAAVGEERPGRLGDQRSGESGGDETCRAIREACILPRQKGVNPGRRSRILRPAGRKVPRSG